MTGFRTIQFSWVENWFSKAQSAKLNTDETFLWLAQNILVRQVNYATTYLSFTVNTVRKSHNRTLSRILQDYPQPRIIFSRLTHAKYHKITRKHSAYWKINTSRLFSYTCLIQVPGCTVTQSADQHRPCFHTRSRSGSKFACNFDCALWIFLPGFSIVK